MNTGRNSRRIEGRFDLAAIDPVLRDPLEGVAEKGLLRSPRLAELRRAMDLLGDIRKLEVRGKRTRQEKGRSRRDVREAVRRAHRSRLFCPRPTRAWPTPRISSDEVQELLTFDSGKLLAQQGGNKPDVPSQRRMTLLGRDGVVGGDGIADVAAGGGLVTPSLAARTDRTDCQVRGRPGLAKTPWIPALHRRANGAVGRLLSEPAAAPGLGSRLALQSVGGTGSATATTLAEVIRIRSVGSMENTALGVPAAAHTRA